MTAVAENIRAATDYGYEVLDHFTLAPSAWWDEYYTPLQKRVARLRQAAETNAALAEILDDTERAISIYDRYGDSDGYVFFLMRKSAQHPTA